ncbi:MAG: hypothetical protein KA120_07320 [Candidatus Goldbacteria bacterium]|nr:hypothetical protein [Candidatus Goldiibacteriota bacterium]
MEKDGLGEIFILLNLLIPPFLKGDDNKNKFPSLEKRGQGRFYPFKSPSFPLFQRDDKKRKFPSLEKRG